MHANCKYRMLMAKLTQLGLVAGMCLVLGVGSALAAGPDPTSTPTPTPAKSPTEDPAVSAERLDAVAVDLVTRNLVSTNGATVTVYTSITDPSGVKTERGDPKPVTLEPGGVLQQPHAYPGVKPKGRYLITQRILATSGAAESKVEQEVSLTFDDSGLPQAKIASKTGIPEPGNGVLDLKDPQVSPLLISVKIGRVKLEVTLTAKDAAAIKGELKGEFSASPRQDGAPPISHVVPAGIEGVKISATSPMFVSPLELLPFRVRLIGPQGATLADVPAKYNFATGGVLVDSQTAAPFDRERFTSVSLYGRDSAQSYDIKLPPLREVGETEAGANKEGRPIRVTIDYLDPEPGPVLSAATGAAVAPTPKPVSPGSLTIQAVRADNGEPLAQSRVQALQGSSRYLGRTSPDGLASFKTVPAGDLMVSVESSGFKPSVVKVKVESGTPTHQVVAMAVKPTATERLLPWARWAVVALVGLAVLSIISFALYRRSAQRS